MSESIGLAGALSPGSRPHKMLQGENLMNLWPTQYFLNIRPLPDLSGLDPPGVSGLVLLWLNEAACPPYYPGLVGDIVLDWA